jgi:glycerate dehydrogenase
LNKAKIVFLDCSTLGADIDLKAISQFGDVTYYESTKPSDVIERCFGAEIIITNKVSIDCQVMKSLPHLKLICITATGMNNVDLDYASKSEILVKNIKNYSTHSVVQHTFSMLFYLMSSSKYYDNYVKDSLWDLSPVFTHLGKPTPELHGKKWGIIGLGEIGRSVANVACAFGCDVSYYSTSGKNHNQSYTEQSLDELLTNSDIISIHAPLNEKTHDLINDKNLSLIKDGAFLLNLGRGGIINEKDIIPFIKERRISVGLDVLEVEPIQSSCVIKNVFDCDNFFLTPHIAWGSIEARQRLLDILCVNISEYLNSKTDN